MSVTAKTPACPCCRAATLFIAGVKVGRSPVVYFLCVSCHSSVGVR